MKLLSRKTVTCEKIPFHEKQYSAIHTIESVDSIRHENTVNLY